MLVYVALGLLALWNIHLHASIVLLRRNQRKIMSDLDTLNTALAGISSSVDAIATETGTIGTEVSALEQKITDLQNANPAIDLSGAIASAQAIQSRLDNVTTSLNDVAAAAASPAQAADGDQSNG